MFKFYLKYFSSYEYKQILFTFLGCIVRAFDPSQFVERPENSYHPNLFFYNIGIDSYEHSEFYVESQTKESFKTLHSLIEENQDIGQILVNVG